MRTLLRGVSQDELSAFSNFLCANGVTDGGGNEDAGEV